MESKYFSISLTMLAALVPNMQAKSHSKPNIIIILADDMGFSDPGCYGGEIKTPNLDYLAQKGVRFTQFYNTSRSCPTRASLLTGLYQHEAGIGHMTDDNKLPGYRGQLTEQTVTIAEVLKGAGYSTGMVGKWHVSNTNEQKNPAEQLKWLNHQDYFDADFSSKFAYPINRGFDKYYGNIWGVVDYFDPFSLVNGDKPVKNVPDNYYHTIAITDTTCSYIKQFHALEKPFFLYVAYTAPHWPLQALPEDIEKYKDTYKVGWDVIRENRYKKMIQLGLFDSKTTKLSPESRNDYSSWDINPNKEYDARCMSVHAAMIDRLDQGIGQIIATLKATGQLENTVIMFLSDNGASPELPAKAGFDRCSETRDGRDVIYTKNDKSVMPGSETTYTGIGPDWANVANTPFKLWKKESFEGGICTPFIAYWPAGIKKQVGTINNSTCHVMDLMATCIDLAKTKYPETYNDHKIIPLEGLSIVPILFKGKRQGHKSLFFEHYDARALRVGDWKLVSLKGENYELYNIAKDRTELHNLAAEMPEKVNEMKTLWEKEAYRVHAFPAPKKKN